MDSGIVQSYGLTKHIEAVKNCRNIGKKDMKNNDVMPKVKVRDCSLSLCSSLPLCLSLSIL